MTLKRHVRNFIPYLEYWKNWNIGRFLSLGGMHVSIFFSDYRINIGDY